MYIINIYFICVFIYKYIYSRQVTEKMATNLNYLLYCT